MTPPLCWRQARCPRFGGQLGQHPEEVLCKCGGHHICCDVTFWSAHAIADVCGSTGGQCPAYQQANSVILPKEGSACEEAGGKANVLHLSLESGTDLILFNVLMTEIG